MTELAWLIDKHAKGLGPSSTDIPLLSFSKRIEPAGPLYGVQKLAFCVTLQGLNVIQIADKEMPHGPGEYFISTFDFPVTGFAKNATPEKPFLVFLLELTPQQVLKVIQESDIPLKIKNNEAVRGVYVNQLTPALEDAATRLARLLESPEDIGIMAPMITREIIYRLLQEPKGHILASIALEGSSNNKVSAAINYIMDHYTEPFKVNDLAQLTNMSSSTFHRYFKEVTAMSPLQFQKQLRLQKARELLRDSSGVTEVAYQIGYESSSQFSREYSRMFGASPREDMKRFNIR